MNARDFLNENKIIKECNKLFPDYSNPQIIIHKDALVKVLREYAQIQIRERTQIYMDILQDTANYGNVNKQIKKLIAHASKSNP